MCVALIIVIIFSTKVVNVVSAHFHLYPAVISSQTKVSGAMVVAIEAEIAMASESM